MSQQLPEAQRPISALDGVGPKSASLFRGLGIETASDLLHCFPYRYDDWREPTPAASLQVVAQESAGEVNALGRVLAVKERRARDYEIVEVRARDDSGVFIAKWIGRHRFVIGRFREGMRLFVRGRLERSLLEPIVNVSHYRMLAEDEVYRGEMIPIYRASKDLPSRKIASVVKRNLPLLLRLAESDALPPDLARRHRFPELLDAYKMVHAPATPEQAQRARERFVFTEFLVLAAGALLRRARRESEHDAAALTIPKSLLDEFEASLPFALTGAQRRAIGEIWNDMARDVPMNRLLQGDVGSGKTLVAAAAVVLAARHGHQAALMAPTEILAMQHLAKLAPLLVPFKIGVEAVLGSQTPGKRQEAARKLASGEAGLAIGTHALLTESVEFDRLGLAIIDEQHRFGVEHRARLRAKGETPHTLHMTATPIPRTLAQVVYADFDESKLDEMPPGRTPVETFAVRFSRIHEVYAFVRASVAGGGQAYIVAPTIDEGETGRASAVAEFERLKNDVFPNLRLGLVHGRLGAREKEEVMRRFERGEIDVLVATSVIEVGVDVPNATIMVVLDAQHYGLAQLHQLRGRVGRGAAKSYCIYVYPDDRDEGGRLEILTETNDGFAIAEADLDLRGSGRFAGTEQHGKSELQFGDLAKDFAVYKTAREAAQQILARDARLERPEHAGLRAALDSQPSLHSLRTSS